MEPVFWGNGPQATNPATRSTNEKRISNWNSGGVLKGNPLGKIEFSLKSNSRWNNYIGAAIMSENTASHMLWSAFDAIECTMWLPSRIQYVSTLERRQLLETELGIFAECSGNFLNVL